MGHRESYQHKSTAVSLPTIVKAIPREAIAARELRESLFIWGWLPVEVTSLVYVFRSKASLERGRARIRAALGLNTMAAWTSGHMTSPKPSSTCPRKGQEG